VLDREREPVGLRVLPGGGVEQSPVEWWRATAAACRRLAARADGDTPAAVAVTAQWAGTVPVGADGEALSDALIWMDARGAPFVRRAAGGPIRVAGYGPLRQAIAAHIGVTRAVRCAPEQVIVTSGAQQAFDLLFRVLLDPGDRAWIEEPGYLDVRAALLAAGARLVPVPVDEAGVNVEEGIRLGADARVAVVSPSHQYPVGVTLSATRRLALLGWARSRGAWIVEDDYDSYFRYRGRPLPALQRLESDWLSARSDAPAAARVLYVGTFSKTMFPSLRLGYCVVPPELAPVFANARAIADRNSPIVDQAALEIFIDEGHYDRHLRRIRAACLERYEAMMHAARRHLAGVVSLAPMNAGTHVMGTLSPGYPAAPRLEGLAREEGIVLFPLSRYCIRRPARDAIILGYGGLTPRAIDTGVRRLASILETHRDSGRSRKS